MSNIFIFWQEKFHDTAGLYSFLGPAKAAGILRWHAVTGCDTTRRFAGRGKKSWRNLYLSLEDKNDQDIIKGFENFGVSLQWLEPTEKELSRFIARGNAKDIF